MGYFDQIIPPPNHQNLLSAVDKFTLINQMIERVEKRALDIVNEKYPYMRDMTGTVIIDPYADYSPEDHVFWLKLLQMAESRSRELYARLFYLRGVGTKLIPNKQWGFVFQPVIGPNGWNNIEQYNQEKTCLNDYGNQVIELLKFIAMRR
ncbi:hypothetical protein [Sporomusa acidovorans]|uniref:Uncharacterized protein n=1 Tax=Sporomusa acidovorans (strain ATCC 49682 / DSM 3132 / Mol) TaxID=1123286 RepID=A0ABZ3J963_SPOA4|nr:hypothetical protein [Sporomusa acidovorans]OZC16031.1 hypothetical protein SPACI_43970 [Sporomusa acidovorans DSM 3132]SDD89167.1 hypothetical protein SAMN04488499_1005100 [Sporomusa acidovorans]